MDLLNSFYGICLLVGASLCEGCKYGEMLFFLLLVLVPAWTAE